MEYKLFEYRKNPDILNPWVNRELIRAHQYRETGKYSRDYIEVPDSYTTPGETIKRLNLPAAVLDATLVYYHNVKSLHERDVEWEYHWLGKIEKLLNITFN